MKIHVCSMFRDSQSWAGMDINQVERFFAQMAGLSLPQQTKLSLWLIEGDSVDNTPEKLVECGIAYGKHTNIADVRLFLGEKNKHFSLVCSTTNKDRIQGLSTLADSLIKRVELEDNDYVLWIESDFIIKADTIRRLIRVAERYENTIVAPWPMDEMGNFYDTWAFTGVDGKKFNPSQKGGAGLIEMSSIGSCALIPGSLIKKGCNFGFGAFPELCKRALDLGAMILCDTDNVILHPKSMVINNRAI
jgi:hypothetical protein